MLIINGAVEEHTGLSLGSYLTSGDYDCRRVAVEVNGVIVPRGAYDTTILKDGDRVEIVQFVGGG